MNKRARIFRRRRGDVKIGRHGSRHDIARHGTRVRDAHVRGPLLLGGWVCEPREFTSRGRVGMRVRIRVISGCLFAMRDVQEFNSKFKGGFKDDGKSFRFVSKLYYIIRKIGRKEKLS